MPVSSNDMSFANELGHELLKELGKRKVEHIVGKHKIALGKRAVSEILEKHCIDILKEYLGNNIEHGNWRGYDIVVKKETGSVFVNLKTQDIKKSKPFNVTWISTKRTVDRIRMNPEMAARLLYIKLDYEALDSGVLEVKCISIAGPLDSLNLILFDRSLGSSSPYSIPKYYNGAHYFLPNEDFIDIKNQHRGQVDVKGNRDMIRFDSEQSKID